MNSDEIYKMVKELIGRTDAYGNHDKNMSVVVTNVDDLGKLVMMLYGDLQDIIDKHEHRPESSIKAVCEKARYWLDFIEKEVKWQKNN